MTITPNNILLIVSILLSISVLAGKAGGRFGVPALVLFLGVGMLAGVDGAGLHFDSAEAAQFIGMVSLSIILFSGGLDTDIKQLRPVWRPGLVLATIGVLLTTVLCGIFIYWLFRLVAPEFGFGWLESFLLAAIMSSTDSASVFSILNGSKIGLRQNLKPLLELESGSNDPMAYLLVILLIDFIRQGSPIDSVEILRGIWLLLSQLAVGTLAGAILGYLAVKLINRLKVDNEFLYPVMMIACVFFVFSVSELLGGNSYLAVYVAGLVVGNRKLALKRTITTFFGGFTWLVQIIMFLSLGLLVNPHELISYHVIVPGLLLGVFMILFGRPVAVFLSLLPFRKFTMKARLYISWVGLRGAVPIIFATYALTAPEVMHARLMFNMVFFITLLSLLVQGTSVTSMARWLGLCDTYRERDFRIDLPDEITAAMTEMDVTAPMLSAGDRLKEISLPPDTLVVMVKRNDEYLVPTGNTRLYIGDRLLFLSQDERNLAKIEGFRPDKEGA